MLHCCHILKLYNIQIAPIDNFIKYILNWDIAWKVRYKDILHLVVLAYMISYPCYEIRFSTWSEHHIMEWLQSMTSCRIADVDFVKLCFAHQSSTSLSFYSSLLLLLNTGSWAVMVIPCHRWHWIYSVVLRCFATRHLHPCLSQPLNWYWNIRRFHSQGRNVKSIRKCSPWINDNTIDVISHQTCLITSV